MTVFRHQSLPKAKRFYEINGLIRLGSKYQADDIRDEGIRRLKAEFPSDMASWDKVVLVPFPVFDAFCAVNLARDFDLPHAHNCAIYCATACPAVNLVSGAETDYGSHVSLHPEDAALCICARTSLTAAAQKLHLELVSLVPEAPYRPESRCQTQAVCAQAISQLKSSVIRRQWRVRFFPLSPSQKILQHFFSKYILCDECRSFYYERSDEMRQALRDDLGNVLRLFQH